jgi:uncharacterized protein YycO
MKLGLDGVIVAASIAGLVLGGCATRVADTPSSAGAPISFQRAALDPANGGQLVQAGALRSGDIILSATNGFTSAGIRLLTLAPVSHAAIYLGDDGVAEAVGEGIVVRPLADVLTEEAVVVAFRHPALVADHAQRIREFSKSKVGGSYNHVGVVLLAPFSLERRVCELPLLPEAMRDFCLRGIATIQLGAGSNDRFFCSQFVLEAYRVAGLPITDADPRWISPADILHMREGDVPSMRIRQPLVYVGHLKLDKTTLPLPMGEGWGEGGGSGRP